MELQHIILKKNLHYFIFQQLHLPHNILLLSPQEIFVFLFEAKGKKTAINSKRILPFNMYFFDTVFIYGMKGE